MIIIEGTAEEGPPPAPEGYVYRGFNPDRVNLMTKVQFEQNGRIGYKISIGGGKHIYRSATRERYEHTVGNTSQSKLKEKKQELGSLNNSVYSKSYGEAVKTTEKKQLDQHNRNLKKILKGDK
jgi:hypothetical protein